MRQARHVHAPHGAREQHARPQVIEPVAKLPGIDETAAQAGRESTRSDALDPVFLVALGLSFLFGAFGALLREVRIGGGWIR